MALSLLSVPGTAGIIEEWAGLLGPADRRGLTPLFWQHVRPYGEVRLNMGSRLSIGASAGAGRSVPPGVAP